MIALKSLIPNILESYPLDDMPNGTVFRGVSLREALSYAENKPISSTNESQMPLDPVVVDLMMTDNYGEDYADEMSEEDVELAVKDVCPWYDGSVKSVSGGINAVRDWTLAEDYAGSNGFVVAMRPVNQNWCDFTDDYVYIKSSEDIEVLGIYSIQDSKFYTKSTFLESFK